MPNHVIARLACFVMLAAGARTKLNRKIRKAAEPLQVDEADLLRFSPKENVEEADGVFREEEKKADEDADKTSVDKAAAERATVKAALKSLPSSDQDSLIAVWGRDRLLDLFSAMGKQAQKDKGVVGYSSLYKDFLQWQMEAMRVTTRHKGDRNGKSCSEFPDDVMSHLWRYKIEDVQTCLGAESPEPSFLQSGACDGTQDEIPGSDGYAWTFSKCSKYDAVSCNFTASGGTGCCCPSSFRWDAGDKTCIPCTSLKHLTQGQTCKLRCALLPEVETTLTCGDAPQLQGSAPEGECRWLRDDTPVETHAGSVLGFIRPILWKWNLKQYPEYIPEGMKIPINAVESLRVKTYWDIPFGKPVERFKRPKMVESFESPLKLPDRYADGHKVHQCDPDGVPDCLTLAVDVPPGASKDTLRPVMFWLPGSGFRSSNSWNDGFYDGGQYVLRQDALLVVSNARSSIDGYWASSALAEEDEDHSTGNYGMMDQRLALEWIQKNIANFGGDPARVTIGGHSSGGFSVNFHLFSPHSRDLYSGAITEGSTFDSGWYFQNLDDANDFYANLGVALGCPRDDPKEQISCLRKLDSSAFSSFLGGQATQLGNELHSRLSVWTGVKSVSSFVWSYMGFEGSVANATTLSDNDFEFKTPPLWPVLAIGPVVDGSDAGLPASPYDLMRREDAVAKVPVFLDFAEEEGTLFSLMMLGCYPWQRFPTLTHAAVDAILDWTFGNNEAFTQELLRYYPQSSGVPYTRLANAISDSVFKCSNRRFANALSSKIPIFLGETDYDQSKNNKSWSMKNFGLSLLGPNHLMATMLVFGVSMTNQQGDWTTNDQAISSQLNCYYAFFLHCRDPDVTDRGACYQELVEKKIVMRSCLDPSNHREVWNADFKPWDPAAPKKFKLSLKPQVGEWTAAETAVCDFWDSKPPTNFRMVSNICRGCKQEKKAD